MNETEFFDHVCFECSFLEHTRNYTKIIVSKNTCGFIKITAFYSPLAVGLGNEDDQSLAYATARFLSC